MEDYQYGLLAALIGRVWFGFLGATPFAYEAVMAAGAILFAWAMAQIFAGRKIGARGLALLLVSLGFAFQSSYPNLAHCIEAVLLSHALAQQVRGSNRNALALATFAIFDKPAMGYFFGVILLVVIALELRRQRGELRDFIATISPAAIVFAILSATLTGFLSGLLANRFFSDSLPVFLGALAGATALRFAVTYLFLEFVYGERGLFHPMSHEFVWATALNCAFGAALLLAMRARAQWSLRLR